MRFRENRSTALSRAMVLGLVTALLYLAGSGVLAQEPEKVRLPELPEQAYDYTPSRLPLRYRLRPVERLDNMPRSNPVTDAGATLGRVLFYDRKLSANDTVACASCHTQETGFSTDTRFTTGFQGGHTQRKSMPLANARFYDSGRFFWDERAATLEDQVLMPIQDPVEMGMDLDVLIPKLQATDYYPPLFEAAFGSPTVSEERVSRALAQFVRSMLSYRSRYDEGLENNFADFTAEEQLGMDLFTGPPGRCARCHSSQLQVADEPRNNGLDRVSRDPGVRGVTGDLADDGKFKSPSLRNVALRAPYMHDGRFATLRDVVDFYDDDVQDHRNLDPRLDGPRGPRRLNMSSREKLALIAFMETLTDEAFIADPKFADPFVERVPEPTATASPIPSATSTPRPSETPEPTALPTRMPVESTPTLVPDPGPATILLPFAGR